MPEAKKDLLKDGLVIQVDFYKQSGKWYQGGRVNVGESRLWKGDFLQSVVDNQRILGEGWQGHYYVVTADLPEYDTNPEYKEFSGALFTPERSEGLKRSGVETGLRIGFIEVGPSHKSWEAKCVGELTEDWLYNQAKKALNSSNIQFGDKGEIIVGFRIVGRYELVREG
jgi:hypothetical protein